MPPDLGVGGSRTTFWSLLVIMAIVVSACGSSESEVVANENTIGHIHDFAFDDGGILLAATHTGLYRIEGTDRAVLVGGEQHDFMAMSQLDNGELIAGGHPNLLMDRYLVDDKPPYFGLAQSTDTGESWDIVGLLGEADFHALVPTDEGLFAAEGAGRIWFLDNNGQWSQLGEVQARDLALSPQDPNQQVAPAYDGSVWASTDGAVTWTLVDGAPTLTEIEWVDTNTILAADETGSIWTAETPGGPWTEVASAPTEVETFFVDASGSWWVGVRGGAILLSKDQGSSWDEVYAPPASL